MPALDGALPLAQVHDVAVAVGQHLDLDVARRQDVLLQVDVAHAEGGLRLRLRGAEGVRDVLGLAHDPHATAAASRRGLQDQREADVPRRPGRPAPRLRGCRREPGTTGTPALIIACFARLLSPIRRITCGAGPMKRMLQPRRPRRSRVLGEEAVAGVDGVGVGDLGRADDRGDVEVDSSARRADAHRLVGEAHVQAVARRPPSRRPRS